MKKETYIWFEEIYGQSPLPTWGVGADGLLVENLHHIKNRDICIDLGCGDGRNALYLAKFGGFKKIICVDISKYAIIKLINFAKYLGLENLIEPIVCDMRSYNLESSKFSLIVAAVSLSFLNKRDMISMIERIKNAVKIGGGIYISVFNTRNLENVKDTVSIYDENLGFYTTYLAPGELYNLFANDKRFKVCEHVEPEVILTYEEPRKLSLSAIFVKKIAD